MNIIIFSILPYRSKKNPDLVTDKKTTKKQQNNKKQPTNNQQTSANKQHYQRTFFLCVYRKMTQLA